MTTEEKQKSQLIATWAQFVAVCIGIGTILVYVGRKDAQLTATTEQVSELQKIVTDLAKTQIMATMRDELQTEQIQSLLARVNKLEGGPR
jgi:short-subunit dehydrogenase